MLCLWCPDWPVVALRRRDPTLDGIPVAVLDGGFVLSVSEEARSEGVRRGLRRREAEARCPGLVTRPADPAAEARAFEAVARATETLAPKLALDRPGLLFVPTRGPSRYFGGDAPFVTRLLTEVAGAAPGARAGVADGAFAARLAARRTRGMSPGAARMIEPGGTPEFLAPWPVQVLEDDLLAGLLVRLGLPTLGEFAGLPAASVLGRFGPAGLAAHRRARGEEEHPPDSRVLPPELSLHHEFDPPVARVDMAVFAGRALAERLLDALSAEGLACTRVRVEAETEHGERLARTWRLNPVTSGQGSGGPSVLADRVRAQLDAWISMGEGAHEGDEAEEVTAGLTLLRLVPEEVVVAGRSQLGLWGGDRAAAERAARALVRVQATLGPAAVVVPVPTGGRTPDERITWVPYGEEPPPPVPAGPAPWPGAIPGPAPAVVFSPAPPAELLDAGGSPVTVSSRGEASADPVRLRSSALPAGGGTVESWSGPWLQDLRWWDPPARRRRALWQIVAAVGTGARVACLVATEGKTAHLEAVYD